MFVGLYVLCLVCTLLVVDVYGSMLNFPDVPHLGLDDSYCEFNSREVRFMISVTGYRVDFNKGPLTHWFIDYYTLTDPRVMCLGVVIIQNIDVRAQGK